MDLMLFIAARKTGADIVGILLWSAVLVAAVIAMFGLILMIRRSLTQDGATDTDPPFTLDELRRLHERGELSDEQYETARQQTIAMAWGPDATPSQTPAIDESAGSDSDSNASDPPDEPDTGDSEKSNPPGS